MSWAYDKNAKPEVHVAVQRMFSWIVFRPPTNNGRSYRHVRGPDLHGARGILLQGVRQPRTIVVHSDTLHHFDQWPKFNDKAQVL